MTEDNANPNPYAAIFDRETRAGAPETQAAIRAADFYLDGKPRKRGKRTVRQTERDAAFWSSEFLLSLPMDAWEAESLVLALARYMGQERVSNVALLAQVARVAPETVRRAVRYSGLVLNQDSPRTEEIRHLATTMPDEFGEFARILKIFDQVYRAGLDDIATLKQPLAGLSPFELLIYASLYAFEHLVPGYLLASGTRPAPDNRTQNAWDAINDLLIWKLSSTTDRSVRLTEKALRKSVAKHLAPFLLPPSGNRKPRIDLYDAFCRLLHAQIELNSFISRSADVFCFDDSIEYVREENDKLGFVERDPAISTHWRRGEEKLARLRSYWLFRAIDAFADSDLATATIGQPENHEANRVAIIKAMRAQLCLTEVYGVDDVLTTESGAQVDLFQALLSLELMSAFYLLDFMLPYLQALDETGDSRRALGRLAIGGLMQPEPQNRFPITWSGRNAKIAKLTPWTVSRDHPKGQAKDAAAVLEFWTSDWAALSTRLRAKQTGLHPQLVERPILKMGHNLFQLPWVTCYQNTMTAAINNLRRVGARRVEAREETRRIEERLAERFEERGVRVQLNYQPERTADEDPGEVDLICAQDGLVLVLEVKSSFLRSSQRDAWLHGATTLRKAGQQLQRKTRAVGNAVAEDDALRAELSIQPEETAPSISGWIVDTSIEHDHQRFSGFLKVSLEEVLIALRDDRHLLSDSEETFSNGSSPTKRQAATELTSLYPNGFCLHRFVEVIENELVWDQLPPAESTTN